MPCAGSFPLVGEAEAQPGGRGIALVEAANAAGLRLRLIGGLAIRLLCDDYSARDPAEHDIDLASLSSDVAGLTELLEGSGFAADRQFNALHGRRQLRFASEDGEVAVDVMLDRLEMCHRLEFEDRIERLPLTLDVTDLLLSKLQIVELNEKDLRDVLHLLADFPVRQGDVPETIGLDRISEVVADDWGWWKTITSNLERIVQLAEADRNLGPADPRFDPLDQARALLEHANEVPKSIRWRLRAKVGERVRWYELPEEVAEA